MASAMLFAGVLAVITAIMGGQKRAFEAQRRMEAALVVENVLGEIATLDYALVGGYPTLKTVSPFLAITTKTVVDEDLPGMGVRVHGTHVNVKVVPSITETGVILAEADLYIPEPQS